MPVPARHISDGRQIPTYLVPPVDLGEGIERAASDVPKRVGRGVSRLQHRRQPVLRLLALDLLEHEGAQQRVAHHQPDDAHVAEHEGDELAQEVLDPGAERLPGGAPPRPPPLHPARSLAPRHRPQRGTALPPNWALGAHSAPRPT